MIKRSRVGPVKGVVSSNLSTNFGQVSIDSHRNSNSNVAMSTVSARTKRKRDINTKKCVIGNTRIPLTMLRRARRLETSQNSSMMREALPPS